MSNTLYIKEIHLMHAEWNSVLDLTRDEILSFEDRLEEIPKANTGKDILAKVEQFQNRFIRQKEVMDELRHDIHEDELRIAENVSKNKVAVEHRKVKENVALKNRMQIFQKTFNELKSKYLLFLAEKL
jgi:hypothetical protein